MALSKTTQDHDEIRQWAEARGGKPSEVASTERNGQTGIIRIEFPGALHANDNALKEISWEEFFDKFDASGLALVYQEQTAEGATSNFNKLVHPENVSASARKSAKKAPAKKSAAPQKAPAKKAAPAKKSAPAKKLAGKATVKSVAGKKANAKAPIKSASSKKAPAKKTAVKKAATKKIPIKKSTGAKAVKR